MERKTATVVFVCCAVLIIGALLVPTITLSAIASTEESNKRTVMEFYDLAFTKKRPGEAVQKYAATNFKQHNPYLPDGRSAFADFYAQVNQQNPNIKTQIKRIIADGDLVAVHVHTQRDALDPGLAGIDMFRVNDGKIVEQWALAQPVVTNPVNTNTMF